LIQSMTGFAEKRFDANTLTAKFSIRTLNHRFLDWNYRGPQIGELEDRFRSVCQRKLNRGRIETFLDLSFLGHSNWGFHINEDLLSMILSSFEQISSRMNKSLNISLESMLNIPHVFELKRKDFSEEERAFLEESFEKTLDEVLKTRRREGKEIGKEIRSRIRNIKLVLDRIEKLAKKQPIFIREKLRQRLEELNHDTSLSKEKLAEEAAYYAQKYDLSEEVMRSQCHMRFISELLSPKIEEPVGKKLDFLAQELYREANTINSKSQDIEIIRGILTVKGEIESIRQQVQNIE